MLRPSRSGVLRWTPGSAAFLFLIAFALMAPGVARAQTTAASSASEDPVSALRREIEELKQNYEQRIGELEKRLAELEGGQQAQAAPPPAPAAPAETPAEGEDAELADLRAAAAAAAGEETPESPVTGTVPEPAEPEVVQAAVAGSERNLNRLNPEISITGDVAGFATNKGPEDFDPREFELNFQSAL